MPLWIVSDTWDPKKKAPENSSNGGDDDGLFESQGSGTDRGAHGIGDIVGADVPSHIDSGENDKDQEDCFLCHKVDILL